MSFFFFFFSLSLSLSLSLRKTSIHSCGLELKASPQNTKPPVAPCVKVQHEFTFVQSKGRWGWSYHRSAEFVLLFAMEWHKLLLYGN